MYNVCAVIITMQERRDPFLLFALEVLLLLFLRVINWCCQWKESCFSKWCCHCTDAGRKYKNAQFNGNMYYIRNVVGRVNILLLYHLFIQYIRGLQPLSVQGFQDHSSWSDGEMEPTVYSIYCNLSIL